jgi:hypothetical protein
MIRNDSLPRGRVSLERDGDERSRGLSPANYDHVRRVDPIS